MGAPGGTGEPCVVPPSERAEIRLRDEAAVSLYAVRHAPVSDHRSAAGLADVAAQVGKTFLAAEHQVAGHAGETSDLVSAGRFSGGAQAFRGNLRAVESLRIDDLGSPRGTGSGRQPRAPPVGGRIPDEIPFCSGSSPKIERACPICDATSGAGHCSSKRLTGLSHGSPKAATLHGIARDRNPKIPRDGRILVAPRNGIAKREGADDLKRIGAG